MPRGTATLIGRIDTDWASMAAAGVIGALPIVIFALLVQRHLVRAHPRRRQVTAVQRPVAADAITASSTAPTRAAVSSVVSGGRPWS